MKKIGISSGLYINNKMFNDYKMTCVANNYMNSVILAGAVPFVLPCIANENIIEEQLKNLDGIIFTGGEDCSPALYGEETLSKCGRITPERDEADMLFLKKALELKIPILGICRGTQLLNVILGGSLYQDLSYMEEEAFLKHQQEINQAQPSHKIKIQNNSFLKSILGGEAWVNSFHHQSIKELASCFKISAESSDGVIEAYESISEDYFMLGVQWHPEMMAARGNDKMLELFKKFIEKL